MSLLNLIGISDALAAPANQAAQSNPGSSVFMSLMVAGVVMFYFMVIRPQSKQAKEQKQLLDDISKGDEVLTAGGIVGRINKIQDEFVTLMINDTSEMTMKKSSIAKILPKGSVKSIN